MHRRTAFTAAAVALHLDLFRQLMAALPSPLLDLGERRRELASLFSWAIPTDAARFRRRPPALALRRAFEASPARIR